MKRIFDLLATAYTYLCVGLVTGMAIGLIVFGGEFSFHLNIKESIKAMKEIYHHLF